MSWRGVEAGIKAAGLGHEVVMSPTSYAYIDYAQGDFAIEPKVYASLRLNKAYDFDPGRDVSDISKIKGGQANLWTEQIYNIRQAEYMTWPRGMAIAEAVWSQAHKKNWKNFYPKVEQHFKRLDAAQVKYSPAVYDPIFLTYTGAENSLTVEMSTEIPGLTIHYSFDNSFPDNFYPKYTAPLVVPKDAEALKVITYRDGKPVGRMITLEVSDLRIRAKKR
jgi:hexosaminidase